MRVQMEQNGFDAQALLSIYLQQSSLTRAASDGQYADTQTLRRLARRLRRKSAVRRMIEAVLRNGPQPIDDPQPLLVALCNESWKFHKEKEAALWLLDRLSLSAQQRQLCAEELQQHVEDSLKRDVVGGTLRWLTWTIGLSLTASILILFTVGYPFVEMFNFATVIFLLALLSLFISAFVGPLMALVSFCQARSRPVRLRPAVKALGHLRAAESVGVLAEAFLKRPLRRAAAPALSKAMYALTPEHYGQLGSKTVPNLCRALDAADAPMREEILVALEKMGDARAIRPLERLTDRGVPSAKEVLKVLYARREQDNQSSHLLRASTPPVATPEELLRPAFGVSEAHPEQLLRASVVEEKPT